MCRKSLWVAGVGLILFGGESFQWNQVVCAQGRRAARLESRWERRVSVQRYGQGAPLAPADEGWVKDNAKQTIRSSVGFGLSTMNRDLGRLNTAYGVARSTDQYFNSGTPGDPVKGMQALAGVFSGPLGAAGVGPQAGFITKFAETAGKYAMGKHDEATATLRAGIAQQQLDQYEATRDPRQLGQAAMAARPELTYRQLHEWDTRKPLTVQTHPGMPGQQPGTAIGDLAKSWQTTVEKTPFRSNATSLPGRVGDWANWKLDPNNIVTRSTFDRTFHEPDGTTRVQIQRQQTGWGYQPGQTRIYEHTRTEFRGNRVETIGGGTQGRWNDSGATWLRGDTQSGPSRFGGSTQSRPSYGGSSFSRPSFSSPSRSGR